MFDRPLASEILLQILMAAQRIDRRFAPIESPDEFLDSDDGLDRMDAICMMLILM